MKIDFTGLQDSICVVGVPYRGVKEIKSHPNALYLQEEVSILDQRDNITQIGSRRGHDNFLVVLEVADLHVRCTRLNGVWSFGVALAKQDQRLPEVKVYLHQDEQDTSSVALVLDLPDGAAGELYLVDYRGFVFTNPPIEV